MPRSGLGLNELLGTGLIEPDKEFAYAVNMLYADIGTVAIHSDYSAIFPSIGEVKCNAPTSLISPATLLGPNCFWPKCVAALLQKIHPALCELNGLGIELALDLAWRSVGVAVLSNEPLSQGYGGLLR